VYPLSSFSLPLHNETDIKKTLGAYDGESIAYGLSFVSTTKDELSPLLETTSAFMGEISSLKKMERDGYELQQVFCSTTNDIKPYVRLLVEARKDNKCKYYYFEGEFDRDSQNRLVYNEHYCPISYGFNEAENKFTQKCVEVNNIAEKESTSNTLTYASFEEDFTR